MTIRIDSAKLNAATKQSDFIRDALRALRPGRHSIARRQRFEARRGKARR